ncbi:hypothetical protein J5Y03_11970 [Bacillus sp. RG28]|uniref:DUF4129 domain-containing protein n=1 Tax=Gottfriedia endophytica TaxID=2820819 RepID=A0A940NRW3_9BACI|nr:hypothetical protein [Gottfriedia endophytica]MBP0725887.1 hypothetical protein [Gottfriedia endophytica]
MDYFKRISRIVLIALPLSLILAIGILFTQQMIKAKIPHEKRFSPIPFGGKTLYGWITHDNLGPGKNLQTRENIPLIKNKKTGLSNHSNQNDMLFLYIIIIIIIIILLSIISIIFFIKRKKKIQSNLPTKETHQLLNTRKPNKKQTNLTKQSLLPTEQIRIMLIEWEKQLPKTQQRRTYETIQQWFERIGKDVEFVPFYEKVRYGKKQLLNEEIEIARKFLDYS